LILPVSRSIAVGLRLDLTGHRGAEWLRLASYVAHAATDDRSLQQNFQRSLGSPGQVVRQVRLRAAHEDLVSRSPEEVTVASVAARWGFPHSGRVASTYRDTYGVAPSETLRHRS
jgi:transcriptional regulator GlxA family with amidase domain